MDSRSVKPSAGPPPGEGPHDWLHTRLPSWAMSLLFHAAMCFILMQTLRGSHGPTGPLGAEDRPVGIVQRPNPAAPQESSGPPSADSPPSAPALAAAAARNAVAPAPPLPDQSPVPLPLPELETKRLGPGPLLSAAGGSENPGEHLLRPAPRSLRPAGSPQRGDGGTGIGGPGWIRFFDGQATGDRIAFVIDGSGSMGSHLAINVAKAELLASLQNLTADQKFQVIFYTSVPAILALENQRMILYAEPESGAGRKPLRPAWLPATHINRTLAAQCIQGFKENGGTDHLKSLELALTLKPDVLFFLTDADEPQLTRFELEELHRRASGCHIHTVEFGKGGRLHVDNFLVKLARQNQGTYSYRDVLQFESGSAP